MIERGIPPDLGPHIHDSGLTEREHRRFSAETIWGAFAIPWRINGSDTHIIYYPDKFTDYPVIRAFPTHQVVTALTCELDARAREIKEIEKKKPRIMKWLSR